MQKGEYAKAIESLEKAVELSGGNIAYETYLGYAYGVAGMKDKASKVRRNLQKIADEKYVSSYNFAMIYLGLGDMDETFKFLEKAYERTLGIYAFSKCRTDAR